VIDYHAFDDPRAQTAALVEAVSAALQTALTVRHATRVTLAVSGGQSPRLFLRNLAEAPLEWARIDVTLVDERWVPSTDAASNAGLVQETLLRAAARAACFYPLADTTHSLDAYVAALNQDPARVLPHVAVLGMGEDGHTASLFADAPEWQHATSTHERFVAMHPVQAPHARVSLSLDALTRIDTLFLLIAGKRKLDVLNAAVATPQENTISKLANHHGVKLNVYWCEN